MASTSASYRFVLLLSSSSLLLAISGGAKDSLGRLEPCLAADAIGGWNALFWWCWNEGCVVGNIGEDVATAAAIASKDGANWYGWWC